VNTTTSPRRAVLVTGPTRGLGRELVQRLVDGPMCDLLVLVGRPGAALERVAEEARTSGAVDVVTVGADLSSMADTSAAADRVADELARRGRTLDAIALNAALQMQDARTPTVDGFETTFAVGLLANHLLLHRLQSHLSTDAHVVIVGSGTHYGQFPATMLVPGPSWRDPAELARPWTGDGAGSSRAGRRAYATMKLGVNLLAAGWRTRLGGVRINVFDPGLMPGTGLVRTTGWRQVAWDRVMPALRILPGVSTPELSGTCFADLLMGVTFPSLDGGYVEIADRKEPSEASKDPALATELVAACDQLLDIDTARH
jgi:NAD(P)-dependent dehydrogenase (short-subunit alcohol dehydrogenase family)